MKRYFILFIISLFFAATAAADTTDIDLSDLSFDELVALREQINLAIWDSKEWQEVTVPAGVWEVGKDIPIGYWTITPIPNTYISVVYCDKLNEFGNGPGNNWVGWSDLLSSKENDGLFAGKQRVVNIDMKEGMYFINRGDVIFTPYHGKPDLGFK